MVMILETPGEPRELDQTDPMMRIEMLLQEAMDEFLGLSENERECFRGQVFQAFQMERVGT
jgi:hypothetical protein